VWVLDADLTAAFDRIDHHRLMTSLGTFPARDRVEQWLTAGVVEHGLFTPTQEGTPQGGVISPALFNVALHGLEQAAGVRYLATGRDAGSAREGSPVLVRFADDFVVMCHSREQAEQVKTRLAAWLAPRGLAFNEDKTRIVHADAGFDFLGFNVRRYHGKLLIKPSPAAIRRIRNGCAASSGPCAGPTPVRSYARSTRWCVGGRPTTGRWCPARSSPNWTTTCGPSLTSGPNTATRTSRSTGS